MPADHVFGYGCFRCAGAKSTIEYFVEKAKKIHGDRYNYDKVVYVNNKTKVIITCPKHGDFLQTPSDHMRGGCLKCAGQNKSTQEFISEGRSVHGDRYDYSKVVYVNAKTKVTITCPTHGDFSQTSSDHLKSHGCPICNESKGEKTIASFLENNNILFEREKRFKNCRNKLPLSFDFYLPDLNLCIEYDGRQHFKSLSFWGGEKGFKRNKNNDKIKNEYCENNKINLLRISYKDFKNINKILENNLSLIVLRYC